ncbi:MAG: hypothetical protein NDI94_02155 [Candidatus Woesearchaeota archaeon]|nr:hypothetical protein [Candidatus Woesearchaeota archaeon]
MRMKKRGIVYQPAWFIVRLLILFGLFGIFYYVSHTLMFRSLSSQEVSEKIVLNRIFYSPHSITYVDENGRVYPTIIDITKFDSLVLDEAIFTRDNNAATWKLELDFKDSKKESYINKELYERWKNYVKFEQYSNINVKKYVLVKEGHEMHPGVIKISLVMHDG